MPHPLELRLASLRRRARQHVIASAAARAIALVLGTALVLMLIDRSLRLQDRGLRIMLSAALAAAAVVGLRRIVRAVRGSRYGNVELAQRIEAALPAFRGRLASAVAFLREREDDPLAGSVDLRRAVVRDVTPELEAADLSALVDRRPARRAAITAALWVLFAVALMVLNPSLSRIALLRLANPLNHAEWPRANQLAIPHPVERLPAGETFEVEIIDRYGRPLPGDVTMQYRFTGRDGETIVESEPAQFVGATVLARREGVDRPFAYRAVGGDDHNMAWTSLEVVEPPQVRDVSVTLHYPAYTGWRSRPSDVNIRALAGTTVELRATSSKPLAAAAVVLPNDQQIPASLGDDALSFSVLPDAKEPFVVRTSGVYGFSLEDREGFHSTGGPKYELRSLPDETPTVEISQPKGNIFLVAGATLPLRVTARDDLALRRAMLHVLRSDQSEQGETVIELLAAAPTVTAEQAAASAADDYAGDTRHIDYDWALKPLELAPGTQLMFHVSAEDYAGQVGQSLPRRVSIVTAEEMQNRLADRQALIFNELTRIAELERTARGHVAGIEVQITETGKLTKSDVDALQGASLNQQQVERELTNDHDGLRGQVADYLAELRINNIDAGDTARPVELVGAELARLADGALPDAARELSAAIKAAQVELPADDKQELAATSAPAARAVRQPLTAAAAAQDEVVASLDRLQADLQNSVKFRHFYREVGELSRAEEEIVEQTKALGRATLARSVDNLDPQQRADLKKLGARQSELARRFDRLEQQMQQAADSAAGEDPLAAEAVGDALFHARRSGIAGAMRQAGQNIGQNKMGEAARRQQQIGDDLREVLDILSNRREHELTRLVKKLREAEAQLAELREEQQGLRRKLDAARDAGEASEAAQQERQRTLERLSRQQRQLAEQTERFARQVARLQAEKASAGAGRAGAKMAEAAEQSQRGYGGGAADKAAAAESDLAQAQQDLAAERQQAEADLASEQLARVEDAITNLHQRQSALIDETLNYQRQETAKGALSRAEALSVRDLARQEAALAEEAAAIGKSTQEAAVLAFAFERVRDDMAAAAERLDRRDLGGETVRYETLAQLRLEQILASIKEEEEAAQQQQQDDGANEGNGGEDQNDSAGNQLAVGELKLLRTMQQYINLRTLVMDQARSEDGNLVPGQEREFAELKAEQGKLADLIINLSPAADKRPEDNPEQLPDLRRQRQPAAQPEGETPAGETPASSPPPEEQSQPLPRESAP